MSKTIGEIAAEKIYTRFREPGIFHTQAGFFASQTPEVAEIIDSCLPAPDPELIKARELATEYARLYECAETAVAENCRTIARLEEINTKLLEACQNIVGGPSLHLTLSCAQGKFEAACLICQAQAAIAAATAKPKQ